MPNEQCLTEDCDNPVCLEDGQYCKDHSPLVRRRLSQQVRDKMKIAAELAEPLASKVASKGIHTSSDFANFMGALMADLVSMRIEPNVANAACNAGDRLLRVVDMQMKLGTIGKDGNKILRLTDNAPVKKLTE
jgi:hypothetical protein